MSAFIGNLRHGVRLLAKSPGVTVTAVLALALGIGANSAIFSIVYNVLLSPLPFRDPATLFVFSHHNEQRKLTLNNTPYPDVVEWRKQLRSVEAIGTSTGSAMNLLTGDTAERVLAERADRFFLPVLGVAPAIGRNFAPEEDNPGGPRVALISHQLWNRKFNADPNVAGQPLVLDGDTYTIIGVMPRGFRLTGERKDVLIPLAAVEARAPRPTTVTAYGRIRPGFTAEQLRAEMEVLTAASRAREPRYKDWQLIPSPVQEWIVPDVKVSLLVLMGAVGLVLLIACANVATLLLSQAGARKREIALRAALGAGRGRLLGQIFAESIPLGLAGGVLGLGIASLSLRAIPLFDAGRIPRLAETTLDPLVILFTVGIVTVTCVLFGLAPAFLLSRADLQSTLKEGGRAATHGTGGRRLRAVLVASEVAVALILGVGAMLMAKTFERLANVDPGFSPEGVLSASLDMPRAKLKAREQVTAFYAAVTTRVKALPGVAAVGLTNSMPLGGNYFRGDAQVEGRPSAQPHILDLRAVDPGYFEALRIPLKRGRVFTETDRNVIMINEAAARRLFPDGEAVGRRMGDPRNFLTVVGVIADIKHTDVATGTTSEMLLPFHENPAAAMTLAIRLDRSMYPDPEQFLPVLRRAVAEVDKTIAVHQAASLEHIMSRRLAPRRVSMLLLTAFATLSLVLAAMGIYGVLAFNVQQRTHEIGIRMALGAREHDVLRMVIREALLLVVLGTAVGIGGAAALTRLAKSILYGVTATDPATFAGTAAVLTAVAMLASYIPAKRALRVDPVVALRHE